MLVDTKLNTKYDIQEKELVEQELAVNYEEQRKELRQRAKQQILKVQAENKSRYDLHWRSYTNNTIRMTSLPIRGLNCEEISNSSRNKIYAHIKLLRLSKTIRIKCS